MVRKTDKKQNKAILDLQKQLAAVNIELKDIKALSPAERNARTNGLYEKWKQENQWQPPDDNEPLPDPCEEGFHRDEAGNCVPDEVEPTPEPEPEPIPEPEPEPEPTPTPGTVVFDSQRDTRLHDSQVRTIEQEGDLETRASGDPKIVVNNDGTFSLVCKAGHGRIYPYIKNYNSVLEIECAFWKTAPGQDLSLKLRSRHNEAPDDRPDAESWDGVHGDAFGGVGLSVDNKGWGAKIEPEHNFHPKEMADDGDLPGKFEPQKYFKIFFRVMDDDNKIKQTGKIDYLDGKGYQEFMQKVDNPKPFMVDKALYDAKSYFWIRQNIDSGTGEIRFKRVTLTAL